MRRLPLVAELADGALLPVRHEDRIEAESPAAARLARDPACEDAYPSELLPLRSDRHELRDVARAAIFAALELSEQLRDRPLALRCVTRRMQPRTPPERSDLQAGILAD